MNGKQPRNHQHQNSTIAQISLCSSLLLCILGFILSAYWPLVTSGTDTCAVPNVCVFLGVEIQSRKGDGCSFVRLHMIYILEVAHESSLFTWWRAIRHSSPLFIAYLIAANRPTQSLLPIFSPQKQQKTSQQSLIQELPYTRFSVCAYIFTLLKRIRLA